MKTASKPATRRKQESGSPKVPATALAADLEVRADLGKRIRKLRRDRDWNLADLSERTGIALSTLSKVERNDHSLTYDRLLLLSHAFGVPLTELISDRSVPPPALNATRRSIAAELEGTLVQTKQYEYRYLCADLAHKRIIPVFVKVLARSLEEFGPLLRHEGEEFIFVIKGTIEVHTQHYQVAVLNQFDGVYIDSAMGHAYINVGKGEAWLISSMTDDTDPQEAFRRSASR